MMPLRVMPLGAMLFLGAALAVGLALALSLPAAASPTLDEQVEAIAGELMCPVCAGQTVAESTSALAAQMRQEIRARLQRGETRDQIVAYFVSEFGASVRAAPPARGAGLALWLTPLLAFAGGALIAIRYVRRMARTGAA